MSVERTKEGYPNLMKALEDFKRTKMAVGYFPAQKHLRRHPKTGGVLGEVSTAYVASIHEYGATHTNRRGGVVIIPARPFLRPTAEAQKTKWAAMMAQVMKNAAEGKVDFAKGLEILGFTVTADIKIAIDDVTEPALAEYTLAQRRLRGNRGTKPLTDTWTMRNTITHQVQTDGEAIEVGK